MKGQILVRYYEEFKIDAYFKLCRILEQFRLLKYIKVNKL